MEKYTADCSEAGDFLVKIADCISLPWGETKWLPRSYWRDASRVILLHLYYVEDMNALFLTRHFNTFHGFFNEPACEKLFSHFEHWNGLSPVWVLSWLFKLLGCEKALGTHCALVWLLTCVSPLMDLQNMWKWEAFVKALEWLFFFRTHLLSESTWYGWLYNHAKFF